MPTPSTFMAVATPAGSGGSLTATHTFTAGNTQADPDSSSSSTSSHSSASSESSESSLSGFLNATSSSSSSEEERARENPYPHTIDGDRYLAIAQFYSAAYEEQIALPAVYDDAVQQLRCQDDITVTVDLLGPAQETYLLAKARLSNLSGFLKPVQTIQRHVERRSGMSVEDWIVDVVPGGKVPAGWAVLSKAAGYDIESVIDRSTASSSSSS